MRSRRAVAAILLLGVAAFGGLVALGNWQVARRAWKLDLIERVEARVHAAPVPAPPTAGPADEYRRVTATGRFIPGRDRLVTATTVLGGGFWVMTPLAPETGPPILVNRGFVPGERSQALARKAPPPAGPVTVTGLLRLTEPGGGFLRTNVPAEDRWYSRDVAAIAAAQAIPGPAPYFIDADAPADPANPPVAGLTVVRFANNHLVYALTWYGLALMVAGAICYLIRDHWRQGRPA